jgi:hypothetical protein
MKPNRIGGQYFLYRKIRLGARRKCTCALGRGQTRPSSFSLAYSSAWTGDSKRLAVRSSCREETLTTLGLGNEKEYPGMPTWNHIVFTLRMITL